MFFFYYHSTRLFPILNFVSELNVLKFETLNCKPLIVTIPFCYFSQQLENCRFRTAPDHDKRFNRPIAVLVRIYVRSETRTKRTEIIVKQFKYYFFDVRTFSVGKPLA